jgi:flavodoxin
MKKLVMYYSLTGNTRLMAESIAQEIDADLLALHPQQEIPAKGVMKFFKGGKAAMRKEEPPLKPLEKDPQDYDVIFIGTPVWAWTYAPAWNTFFKGTLLTGKKIALFCCHGGGKGKTLERMKQVLADNEILGTIDFREPLRSHKDQSVHKVKQWARNLL